ncbi:hypothetical protein H920_06019 [Fukomys damarensis]|uniref:Uncharacterized protein n=1 Tax=Fukomys damarensis TaxID=885580 RepID=A0A091DQ51_FUKDA|nr:hypothetical protein H920_06019 [Fukomys damarensis]
MPRIRRVVSERSQNWEEWRGLRREEMLDSLPVLGGSDGSEMLEGLDSEGFRPQLHCVAPAQHGIVSKINHNSDFCVSQRPLGSFALCRPDGAGQSPAPGPPVPVLQAPRPVPTTPTLEAILELCTASSTMRVALHDRSPSKPRNFERHFRSKPQYRHCAKYGNLEISKHFLQFPDPVRNNKASI